MCGEVPAERQHDECERSECVKQGFGSQGERALEREQRLNDSSHEFDPRAGRRT